MAVDEHQLFEMALAATMNKLDFAFYLKEEQKTALESFLGKKDVFAVLPAGYGKSLIYQLAPLDCALGFSMVLSYKSTTGELNAKFIETEYKANLDILNT